MTYEELLATTAAGDERIVVLTAENRAAIRNLPASLGNRFIDVGIAEQTMVGAAAGLALRGRIPLVHALATFLTLRAFEFIRTDVGIGNLPVKLIGGVPGFLSDANGPTHQAVEDIALMRGIPNVNVFCPADLHELVAGMPAIIADPSPWYVRYNSLPPAVTHTGGFRIGEAEILSRGSLKPIDEAAILSAARETRLLVTLEDHFLTGGLASIVTEVLYRGGQQPPLLSIALPNRWFKPALLDDVLHHEGFTGQQIAERILAALPSTP
jgi:transketolase